MTASESGKVKSGRSKSDDELWAKKMIARYQCTVQNLLDGTLPPWATGVKWADGGTLCRKHLGDPSWTPTNPKAKGMIEVHKDLNCYVCSVILHEGLYGWPGGPHCGG